MSSPSQHAVDATALVAPLTSLWVTGASVLSVVLTISGIVWYGLQIYDWFQKHKVSKKD